MKQPFNSAKTKHIALPFTKKDIRELKSGDSVLLSGTVLTARDASHKRMADTLTKGGRLPMDLNGQVIYYMGPSPAQPGKIIGSAGPTTSSRMDKYTGPLLDQGLICMIGKGKRSQSIQAKMLKKKAIYLAVVGGAGALISRTIKTARVIAYADLGAEAIFQLEIENFPAVVINDIYGADLYEQGKAAYRTI